ncbi:MAG: DUF3052 domain-containing protein [Pseudonocardiales bacterium]|nr:MAG: DUF3052 domain-containing protein [Pseudonocardiales bacterium]
MTGLGHTVGVTAGYSGTPLAQKLGIKPGARLLLLGAPAGFLPQPLPDEVTVHRRRGAGHYDVALLFCPEARRLHRGFAGLVDAITTPGSLWVCWPKRASGVVTDLNENDVREHGLACGLVDVKVAAIDSTWSGLKFVRRLTDR